MGLASLQDLVNGTLGSIDGAQHAASLIDGRFCARPVHDIDLGAHSLNIELPGGELSERRNSWAAPTPTIKRGWLARYARIVTNASMGAVLA